MTTQQPEALRLADWLEQSVQTYPQISEDEAGGYCSEQDQMMDFAAAELRRLHARVLELEAKLEHESKWRDIALQFDNQRLHAKWHIQHLIQSGCGDAEIEHANDFLNKPPLSGEKVLAERLAKLQASQAQRVPLSDELPQGFLSDVLTAAGLVSHGKQCKALGSRIGEAVEAIWKISIQQREAISAHGITQEKQG